MYIVVFEVHECMDTNIINTRDSLGVSTPIYVHTDPQSWAPDELWAPLSKVNYISFTDVTSNATFEYGREHKLKVNGQIVYKFKNDSKNYWAGVDYWPKMVIGGRRWSTFCKTNTVSSTAATATAVTPWKRNLFTIPTIPTKLRRK